MIDNRRSRGRNIHSIFARFPLRNYYWRWLGVYLLRNRFAALNYFVNPTAEQQKANDHSYYIGLEIAVEGG